MPSPRPRPLIVGHRGARALVPENTLPSIERALDLGVQVIELDLHLSRDGQILITHDPRPLPNKCRRIAQALETAAPLYASLDLSAIQDNYIADLNPDPVLFPQQNRLFLGRFAPTIMVGAASVFSPPSLAQVLALLKAHAQASTNSVSDLGGTRLFLEVKRTPFYDPEWLGPAQEHFEQLIVETLRAWNYCAKSTVLSFTIRTLQAIRTLEPQLQTALLTAHTPLDLPIVAEKLGIHVWCPHFLSIDRAMVDSAHAAGLQVIPWTVNDCQEMNILVDWQVDGLITDDPVAMAGVLG